MNNPNHTCLTGSGRNLSICDRNFFGGTLQARRVSGCVSIFAWMSAYNPPVVANAAANGILNAECGPRVGVVDAPYLSRSMKRARIARQISGVTETEVDAEDPYEAQIAIASGEISMLYFLPNRIRVTLKYPQLLEAEVLEAEVPEAEVLEAEAELHWLNSMLV
jgi:hypothetical protein